MILFCATFGKDSESTALGLLGMYAVDMVYIYMGYRTITGTSRVTTYQPSILGATFLGWLNPHDTESTTEIFWNELWSCNVATKHLLAHPSCLGNVIYICIFMYIYIYYIHYISINSMVGCWITFLRFHLAYLWPVFTHPENQLSQVLERTKFQ